MAISVNKHPILARASYTIQIIDDVALYTAELFSTAGNIFQAHDVSTDITVGVFKNAIDCTDQFTDFVWRKFNYHAGDSTPIDDQNWSNAQKGKKTITVTKDDVNTKCKIQCEVYDVIYGDRTLVASQSMTIIDVNDLKPSTTAPTNPTDGQIWVDSSVYPPVIKMWNALTKQWVVVGAVAPTVSNLIRNSNFFTRNANMWTIVKNVANFSTGIRSTLTDQIFGEGDDAYQIDRKWLKLRIDTASQFQNGVSQTKSVRSKSVYTLHNLLTLEVDENGNFINNAGKLKILVNALDAQGNKTRLELKNTVNSTSYGLEALFTPTDKVTLCSMYFETLVNTDSVEVMYLCEENRQCNFLFTEVMLAQINKVIDWQLAPEDVFLASQGTLNFEDIFNALTDNGNMQGIFYDYVNGRKRLMINGAFIQSYNFRAVNKDTGATTFYINDKGEVTINATSFHLTAGDNTNVYTKDETYTKSEAVSKTQFDDLLSDNKITNSEKQQLYISLKDIEAEKKTIDAQKALFNVQDTSYNAYNTHYTNLTNRLTSILSDPHDITTIDGAALKTLYLNYFNSRDTFQKILDAAAKGFSTSEANRVIDDLVIGGKNLIRNSGDFKNTRYWVNNGGAPTIEVKDGIPCLSATGSVAGWGSDSKDNPNGNHYIKIEPATTYIYSCEIMFDRDTTISASTPLHNWVKSLPSGTYTSNYNGKLISKDTVAKANTWTTITIEMYTGNLASGDTWCGFRPFIYKDPPMNEKWWMKSIQLEKGHKLMQWSPAPEDIQEAIDDILSDNKVTANEKTELKKQVDIMYNEVLQITAQANEYSVSTTPFSNAYNAVVNYITSKKIFDNLNDVTDLTAAGSSGADFRTLFVTYNNEKDKLVTAINTAAKNNVTNSINGIVIGGRNLLKKSNYSTVAQDDNFNIRGSVYTLTKDTETLYGNGIAKIVGTGPGASGSNDIVLFSWDRTVTVPANTKYVFSAYMKGTAGTVVTYRLGYGGPNGSFTLTDNWTKYTVNLSANALTSREPIMWTDRATTMYISSPKLEFGTKATDWSPAPEDFQTQLDDIASKVGVIVADNVITVPEKQQLFIIQKDIDSEKRSIQAQASAYGFANDPAYTDYNNKYTELNTKLAEILRDMSSSYTLTNGSAAFRNLFANYYSTRDTLLQKIDAADKAYVNNMVDGIEIGGRNLFRGTANFAIDTAVFKTGWQNVYGKFTFYKDTDGSTAATTSNHTGTPDIYSLFSNFIPVKKGEDIIVSVYIKSPDWNVINPKIPMIYEEYGSDTPGEGRIFYDDVYVNSTNSNKPTIVNNEWIKLIFKRKVESDNAKFVRVRLILYNAGEMHFKLPKFEKGTKVTDWTPAPEDAQQAIDDILSDNKITSNEKVELKKQVDIMYNETMQMSEQANAYSVNATAFSNAYNAVINYITSKNVFSDLNSVTDLVALGSSGADFRALFVTYNNEKDKLMTAINTASKNFVTDTVNTSVSNIKIGGRNLWRWTTAVSGWEANGAVSNQGTADNQHQIQPDLEPIDPHKKLIVQVWNPNKLSNGGNSNRIAWFDTNKNWISSDVIHQLNGTEYLLNIFTPPSNAKFARLAVIVGASSRDYDMKVKIEQGSFPSDWTPAPEDVQGGIDNIKIGGRNIVPRSDIKTTSTLYGFQSRKVSLEPNTEYVFSVNGRVNSPNADKRCVVFLYDNSWQIFTRSITIESKTDITKTLNFTTPGNIGGVEMWLTSYYYPSGSENDGGNATVNWIKIEKGNKATDWSPAPEDLQNQIDDILSDNKITANEKTDLKKQVDIMYSEVTQMSTQAASYGVSSAAFAGAYNAVVSYITSKGIFTDLNSVTDLTASGSSGVDFRALFVTYASEKDKLITAITDAAKKFSTAEATNAINGLVIGGRNLALGTGVALELYGTGADNGNTDNANNSNFGKDPYPLIKTLGELGFVAGDTLTFSYDWEVIGSNISGQFSVGFNNTPWEYTTMVNLSSSNTKGRIVHYRSITSNDAVLTSTAKAVRARGNYIPVGTKVKITNLKVEKGTKVTAWSPAPEDAEAEISTVKSGLESVKTDIVSIKASIGGISDDNKITPAEKTALFMIKKDIDSEYTTILDQASKYSLTGNGAYAPYTNIYSTFNSYVNTILQSMTTVSDINGVTLRNYTSDYYSKRDAILKAIEQASKQYATDQATSKSNEAIGKISVGGRNYFKESSELNGWNGASADRDYVNARNGFIITYTGHAAGIMRVPKVINGNGEWTVSGYIYSTVNDASVEVQIADTRAWGGRINNTSWTRFEGTVNVTNFSADVYNFVDFEGYNLNANIFVVDFKVEKGNKATDWSHAPEDIEADIDNKVDVGGSIADVNSSIGQIDFPKLNIAGAISYDALDSEMQQNFIVRKDSSGNRVQTIINGGSIETGTVTADKVNLHGLSIFKKNTQQETFTINDLGEVFASGTFRSYDFISNENNISASRGWQITAEGDTVFNNANIRGKVVLPSGGITNDYDSEQTYGRNLLARAYLATFNSTMNYNPTTKIITLTVQPGAGDSWGAGLYIMRDKIFVPYGETYCVSFEIRVPRNATWNVDVNNYNVGGTSWSGNDHDEGNVRTTSSKELPANTWTKCYFTYRNTNPANTEKVKLTDNCNWGVVMKDETSAMTYEMRNIKAELSILPTAYSFAPEDDPNPVRFWAGASYDNNSTAPFRVLQDGTLYASKGYFGGTFTGKIEIGNIEIADTTSTRGALIIKDDSNTSNILTRIGEDSSFFKTNLDFRASDNSTYVTFDNNNKKLYMSPSSLFYFDSGASDKSISIKKDTGSNALFTIGTSQFKSTGGQLSIVNNVPSANLDLTIGESGKGTLTVHGEASIDNKLSIGSNVEIKKTSTNGIGIFVS